MKTELVKWERIEGAVCPQMRFEVNVETRSVNELLLDMYGVLRLGHRAHGTASRSPMLANCARTPIGASASSWA